MLWNAAMMALLPLIWAAEKDWPRPMARTWCAMMGGYVFALMLPSMDLRTTLIVYFLIDLVVAWIIVSHPRTQFQKAIGALSAVMLLIKIGYYYGVFISELKGNPEQYTFVMHVLSWIRWAILCVWGCHGAFRLRVGDLGTNRAVGAGEGLAP